MNKAYAKPTQSYFLLLCWVLYFTSYVTRLNYGAALVDIIADTGIAKTAAGLVSTGSFVTYCIGQFVCGFLSDKVRPRLMIFCGLFLSSLTNIVLPIFPTAPAMFVFWCINGFAQAMIWPALIRFMAEFFDGNFFSKACVSVTVASSAGTIFVYLLVPACIALSGWKSVFFASSAIGLLVSLYWLLAARRAEAHCIKTTTEEGFTDAKKPEGKNLFALFLLAPLLPIALSIALHGILKDGVVTWAPTYMSEVYGISASASVLTTVILPLFSIFSVYLAERVDRKWFHNEMKTATVIFTTASIAALLLVLFSGKNAAVSILCMAVLVACMYGVNLMLICYVPKRFDKYGRISTVSGFLNACTYLGSAASSYGFAALAETVGWSGTILTWFLISALASLVCLFCVRKWTRFTTETK